MIMIWSAFDRYDRELLPKYSRNVYLTSQKFSTDSWTQRVRDFDGTFKFFGFVCQFLNHESSKNLDEMLRELNVSHLLPTHLFMCLEWKNIWEGLLILWNDFTIY